MSEKPVQVLLIEDDADFAVVMQMKLVSVTKSRFYVERTDHLSLGLKRLAEGGIDVVLLDLNVKDSQGLPTLNRLHAGAPEVPIVVLTGVYDEMLAAQALQLGAQDYLVKGRFDHEMLIRAIRYSIERMHQEEQLRRILASITSILVGLDSDNIITHWNRVAEAVFGVLQARVLGRPFHGCGVQWDFQPILEGISACRAKDVPVRLDDIVFKRADGSQGWIGLTISLIKGNSPETGGVLIFGADITERRRTEEQLKKAQEELIDQEKAKVVSQLAAGVAHEVKNPLAILLQGIDFLDQQVKKDNPNVPSVLKQMADAVTRADYIVRSLLDLSRSEKFERAPENLNSVIEHTLLLLKHYFDRSRVRVVQHLKQDLPAIEVDRSKMVSTFINLFTNAIQAMPSGGELLITTDIRKIREEDLQAGGAEDSTLRMGDEVVTVSIEDSGAGIPDHVLPKIFEPFFTTKRGKGGTGLGLSVVKNILDLHNGTVEIKNRPDHPGARVTVVLPVRHKIAQAGGNG